MQVDLVEMSLRMVVSLSAARRREAHGILFRILSANLTCNEEVCRAIESPVEGYCRAGSEWLKGAETESRRVGG